MKAIAFRGSIGCLCRQGALLLAVLGAALAGPPAACGQAAGNKQIEYQWDDGAEFGYSFDIEANVEGTLFTVKGTSIYRPAAGVQRGSGGTGTGTAFVVNKDGYLVTCSTWSTARRSS